MISTLSDKLKACDALLFTDLVHLKSACNYDGPKQVSLLPPLYNEKSHAFFRKHEYFVHFNIARPRYY